jgi:predicted small lipoprotein YifL
MPMTKFVSSVFTALITVVLIFGLSGCKKEGPVEKAGKKIDKAVEKTGEEIDNTSDKVKDAVKEFKTKE